MLAELESTAKAYALGATFLNRLVGDFTEADWAYRDPAGHDPRWLVGHLTIYRIRVAQLMGQPIPAAPWEAFFGRGKSSAEIGRLLGMPERTVYFHIGNAMDRLGVATRIQAVTEAIKTGAINP